MNEEKEMLAPEFDTLNFVPHSETGEPIPDMAVKDAKDWVDNGSKL
jgi:hypothetical protein